jgi:hypothetical protein
MNQKLLKQFIFKRSNYGLVTLSNTNKIRLNVDANQLELKILSYNKATGAAIYSTDTDLTATTWVTNPETLKQWLTFAADPMPAQQPDNTQVRYKLNDGTNDMYWDGGTWSVAGATDWNDEATVASNIETFPATTKSLGLVINLVTTDPSVTPTLKQIDVLMLCDVDYIRSLVADSLIPSLREGMRFTVDFAMMAPGGTAVNLRDIETPHNITGIHAVYDHTMDSNHFTNLYSSYETDSKTVFLSSSVSRGNKLWIEFISEPEVYLNFGSQDYTEVSKVPAVVIDTVEISGNQTYGKQIARKSTTQANVRRFPFRLRLDIGVILLAEGNRSLLEMIDKSMEHAAITPSLHWDAIDESISMQMINEGSFNPRPDLSQANSSSYTLRLQDIYLWLLPDEDKYLVQEITHSVSVPGLEGGPNWTQ